MRFRPSLFKFASPSQLIVQVTRPILRRNLLTLAIETSCDDTSVAVLEAGTSANGSTAATLHFHKKVTSDNTAYHGVHPLASLYSHQKNLASLVDEAILHLPSASSTVNHAANPVARASSTSFRKKRVPDFIAVTRGPGMRSNLFTGLDTAKGLAAAWQVGNDCLHGHRRRTLIFAG